MRFQLNREVPSAVRPVTSGTVWLVVVWKATEKLNGRWFGHEVESRLRIVAASEREAKAKIGKALGLSESQWCGKSPEYFLRGERVVCRTM